MFIPVILGAGVFTHLHPPCLPQPFCRETSLGIAPLQGSQTSLLAGLLPRLPQGRPPSYPSRGGEAAPRPIPNASPAPQQPWVSRELRGGLPQPSPGSSRGSPQVGWQKAAVAGGCSRRRGWRWAALRPRRRDDGSPHHSGPPQPELPNSHQRCCLRSGWLRGTTRSMLGAGAADVGMPRRC